MIWQSLSEGFGLGLATGLTCLSTCSPIYSTFLMQRSLNLRQSVVAVLKISVGRFLMYILFGAVAGLLGKNIAAINRSWFTATAYILFSIFLFSSAFRTHKREKGCQFSKWSNFADSPFLLGIVTGINFCPGFLIALTRAVDLSGPLSGSLLFSAFFFGTNLYLIPLAVFGVMGSKKVFRVIAVASAVLVGTWFISQAIQSFVTLINTPQQVQAAQTNEKDIVSILDSTASYVITHDTASFTLFKEKLSRNRKGSVGFRSPKDSIPQGYSFVDPRWIQEAGITPESLKAPGRFILVLPVPDNKLKNNEEYITTIISFLGRFHFKLNSEEGSLFDMSQISRFQK